MCIWRTSIVWY